MIEVISPGILSSIQDLGRIGYRKYGVPVSGAMDVYSAKLANQILGNVGNEAVLECTLIGPKLKFLKPCRFVVSGADFEAKIDGRLIGMNKVTSIESGEILSFGSAKLGMRTYLAVENGFDSEQVLGSASYYPNITTNAHLRAGDKLFFKVKPHHLSIKNAILKIPKQIFDSKFINVYKGPEFEMLSEKNQQELLAHGFEVSSQSNRMGYRLKSSKILNAHEIITSPVQPGTVQLTPSGQLIILGRDAQTTGGYARVLQLSDLSQNILAQKQFGSQIHFKLK